MQIKGMNGESYNVTGQGQGNYNTVGASAGIASFLGLNAGNLFGGCGNGWNRNGCNGPVEVITSEDKPISRYEAGMMDKLAAKDSEISLLKSNTYTDQKIVDATAYLMGKIGEVRDEVRANKDAQQAINMEQAVYNGTNTATIGCLKQQIAQLQTLSAMVVPSNKVCQVDCCCS